MAMIAGNQSSFPSHETMLKEAVWLNRSYFLVWVPIWFASTLLFWQRRGKRFIAVKSLFLTLSQAFMTIIASVFLRIGTVTDAVPCFLELWFITLSILLWLACIFLRAVFLYIKARQNEIALYGLHTGRVSSLEIEPSQNSCLDEFGFPVCSGLAASGQTSPEALRHGTLAAEDPQVYRVSSASAAAVRGSMDGNSSHSLPMTNGGERETSVHESAIDVVIRWWLGNGDTEGNSAFKKLEKLLLIFAGFAIVAAGCMQVFSKTHAVKSWDAGHPCSMDSDYAFVYGMLCFGFCILGPVAMRCMSRFRKVMIVAYDLVITIVLGSITSLVAITCGMSDICNSVNLSPRTA
ncbi:hypothetical protein BC830DRAFT_1157696 [Chytriomyces sp. MP71]|nr:hypothetical protein BC830DRAFT_1157696 [Chytriomyces sp. MP71]